MRVRHIVALLLTAGLVVGSLSGCQDAEPTPKMPTETSSPSPPATESEIPERESAADFIRRWQAAGDRMVNSGELRAFRRMSPGCDPCQKYADRIKSVYEGGGTIEFDGSRVTSVKKESGAPPTFIAKVDAEKLTIRTPGRVPEIFPVSTQTYRLILGVQGGAWVLRHYEVMG